MNIILLYFHSHYSFWPKYLTLTAEHIKIIFSHTTNLFFRIYFRGILQYLRLGVFLQNICLLAVPFSFHINIIDSISCYLLPSLHSLHYKTICCNWSHFVNIFSFLSHRFRHIGVISPTRVAQQKKKNHSR